MSWSIRAPASVAMDTDAGGMCSRPRPSARLNAARLRRLSERKFVGHFGGGVVADEADTRAVGDESTNVNSRSEDHPPSQAPLRSLAWRELCQRDVNQRLK